MKQLPILDLFDVEFMELIKSKLEKNNYYSYKILCDLLGMVNKGKDTRAKDRQIDDLRRFVIIVKEKSKYRVDGFLDTPITKIENRGGSNNKVYIDELQNVLVDYLSMTKIVDREVPLSIEPTLLMEYLGMTNPNYYWGFKYRAELAYYLKMDKKIIDEFFNNSYGEFSKIIESAFNQLQKNGIIRWEKSYVINYRKGNFISSEIADGEGLQYIYKIENNVLSRMEYENIREIVNYNKMLEFKSNVLAILNKR